MTTSPSNIKILPTVTKVDTFQLKGFDISLNFAQNIECGHTMVTSM